VIETSLPCPISGSQEGNSTRIRLPLLALDGHFLAPQRNPLTLSAGQFHPGKDPNPVKVAHDPGHVARPRRRDN